MRNLNRLTISRHDFEKCLGCLKELDNHRYGEISYEALLLCAIIFYSRPFSCNEKSKDAKAAARVDSSVIDQLTDGELDLHKRLLGLRNKAIAHAEWTYHPTNVTCDGIISSRSFSVWEYFQSPKSDIQNFHNLVNKVSLRAHNLTADQVVSRRRE